MGAYKSKTETLEFFQNKGFNISLIDDSLLAYSYKGVQNITSYKIRKNGYLSFLVDEITTWIVISDPHNVATTTDIEIPETQEVKKEIDFTPKPEVKAGEHAKTPQIKMCVENDIPVYLVGPAGTGKNFTLQAIAGDLGLDFYFTNSIQQEYKLTGFIDAGGTFHDTEFYKAFTQGGLFFLDEMDASIPEVLVLLNAAIANRYFEFPNGRKDAHPNFRVVAAGNTIGSGADDLYTGRLVLDQATLDRFVVIEFDYDRNVELYLAEGNEHLVNFVRGLRASAKKQGARATFSYRAIITTVKLEKAGMPLQDIIAIAIFKGMDKDTIRTLRLDYTEGSAGKYYYQFKEMVA